MIKRVTITVDGLALWCESAIERFAFYAGDSMHNKTHCELNAIASDIRRGVLALDGALIDELEGLAGSIHHLVYDVKFHNKIAEFESPERRVIVRVENN